MAPPVRMAAGSFMAASHRAPGLVRPGLDLGLARNRRAPARIHLGRRRGLVPVLDRSHRDRRQGRDPIHPGHHPARRLDLVLGPVRIHPDRHLRLHPRRAIGVAAGTSTRLPLP
jgi:hypothetical protein